MQRSQFFFELPQELIAQYPPEHRSTSRLLVLEGVNGTLEDRLFTELPDLLHPGDLLVFNDTRVIPARLYARKASGGKVEILVERLLDEYRVLAHVRASKSPRINTRLILDQGEIMLTVMARRHDLFELRFHSERPVLAILEQYGHVPLPPYIQRIDETIDKERYQTVYARHPGAVAAPTAGLHFDRTLLETLTLKGVEQTFITLHVGAGTFQPVRVERIEDHRIHSEIAAVGAQVCERIRVTKARGGRVVAVGTTTVRSLESAYRNGALHPFQGNTRLFIYPGYRFHCVDALITNFHLPESTLLMLVAAFAGYENTMQAYRHAVDQRYRFFSYGDAMFITRLGK